LGQVFRFAESGKSNGDAKQDNSDRITANRDEQMHWMLH